MLKEDMLLVVLVEKHVNLSRSICLPSPSVKEDTSCFHAFHIPACFPYCTCILTTSRLLPEVRWWQHYETLVSSRPHWLLKRGLLLHHTHTVHTAWLPKIALKPQKCQSESTFLGLVNNIHPTVLSARPPLSWWVTTGTVSVCCQIELPGFTT